MHHGNKKGGLRLVKNETGYKEGLLYTLSECKMSTEMKTFMVDLAQKAGSALMNYFKIDQELLNLRSTAKEAVTKYDKEVDQLIIEKIRKNYPNHSFLTEESGYHSADPDWLWIVDSLDGTGNFANQNPFFSVCLALMHKGELSLAEVHAHKKIVV